MSMTTSVAGSWQWTVALLRRVQNAATRPEAGCLQDRTLTPATTDVGRTSVTYLGGYRTWL